jgi:phage protein D
MSLVELSPETHNFYAPRFEVEIENQRLTANMAKAIMDVSVDEKLDEGASFTLTVHDEFDLNTQTFSWLDHELFNVGNRVSIKMGYENNLSCMVIGRITRIEPSFFASETPTINITGQDLSFDYLKRSTPERTFVDKSYSDIATLIAREAGMQAKVDSTATFESPLRKDADTTYYRLLENLANNVGYTFQVDRNTIYFVKPKDDKKEIITLALGKDIISFQPSMNTSNLVAEVEVRGHNPADPRAPFIGRARAGEERTQETGGETASQVAEERIETERRVITDRVVTSVEHANAIAHAELNRASDTFITGQGDCVGIPEIRPGINIRLEKIGKKFQGKYYVQGAGHTINDSGYRTHFSVKKNAVTRPRGSQ